MHVEVGLHAKSFPTLGTRVGLLPGVNPQVLGEI